MARDPSGADLERPPRPAAPSADDGRPSWLGFLGGAVVLVSAVLIVAGIWRLAGSLAPALTPAELAETESLLARLGFPPGPVDGVIDEESRDAISDFQLTAGLEVDGTPTLALLDELRAARAELGGK